MHTIALTDSVSGWATCSRHRGSEANSCRRSLSPKPDTCLDFGLGCRVWGLREPQALNRGLVGFRFRVMDLGFL